ncbi:MAG: hotdog fold thioesterase [Steroidobacteraceae bacterium]|jgi:hypothetical protein|nr:hotdog fold thioesterase [Steroidobacteraceae bacterium]
MSAAIVIEPRFRGPPESGNGGYVCGRIAVELGLPVAVRLLAPPPLATTLILREDPQRNRWQLLDGERAVAEARPAEVTPVPPVPPSYAEAVDASRRCTGLVHHPLPTCFVCGPQRAPGDGLRIFAGEVTGRAMVAAPWTPDESLADGAGRVRPEFLWSALDCPGFFAAPLGGALALLGELAVRIERPLPAGGPCVVVGWPVASEGRKHRTGTAVFGPGGELVACAEATWVALKQA